MQTPVPGKSLHDFKTGDKVRFKDDEVNRWPAGKIAGSTGDGRVTVEIEMMGRIVPMQVYPHPAIADILDVKWRSQQSKLG